MFGLGYATASISINLLHPLSRGLNPVSRMVIVGPAGVGKTMLAKWIANQDKNCVYADCSYYSNNKYEGLQVFIQRIESAKVEYSKNKKNSIFICDNAEFLFDDKRFMILFNQPGVSIVLVTRKLSNLYESIYVDERCEILNIVRPTKADSIKILQQVTPQAEDGFVQTIINILFDEKSIIKRLRIETGAKQIDLPLTAANFISGRLLLEIVEEANRIASFYKFELSVKVAEIATEGILSRLTQISYADIEEEVWGDHSRHVIQRIPVMNFLSN